LRGKLFSAEHHIPRICYGKLAEKLFSAEHHIPRNFMGNCAKKLRENQLPRKKMNGKWCGKTVRKLLYSEHHIPRKFYGKLCGKLCGKLVYAEKMYGKWTAQVGDAAHLGRRLRNRNAVVGGGSGSLAVAAKRAQSVESVLERIPQVGWRHQRAVF
jgi:hypothetical protein